MLAVRLKYSRDQVPGMALNMYSLVCQNLMSTVDERNVLTLIISRVKMDLFKKNIQDQNSQLEVDSDFMG